MRRLRTLLIASVLAVAAVVALSPGTAAAHETEQPYAYVYVAPDAVDGRLELSINDVAEVLDLRLPDSDAEIKQLLTANEESLHQYAAQHFSIGLDGRAWDITFDGAELFRESSTLAFAVVQYDVVVASGSVPTTLDVDFDPFFNEIPGRDGLLLVNGGWVQGTYDRDAEALVTFTDDNASQSVDLGDRTQWQNFASSITLGLDHIETGADHIMFVFALLLPSVLVFSGGGWKATAGFGSALWRVLKIATFFTIAHSITFTLAGMGWLPLPSPKIVETIIAASIAAAALHNLKPIFPNREWALSFVFGLFHGMGFASLVASLDVSRGSQLVSLLGRNVGIEIGQVIVILLLFPALYLLRDTVAYAPILTIGSVALAVLSLAWMIERLFETDLGTNGLVEGLVRWPRALVLVAVLTAGAAALRMRLGPSAAQAVAT